MGRGRGRVKGKGEGFNISRETEETRREVKGIGEETEALHGCKWMNKHGLQQ